MNTTVMMSCQYFKRGIPGKVMENEVAVIGNASVGDLSTDVLANVFGFLGLKDIVQKRRVSKNWTEAVKKTIVPLTDFRVDSVRNYNAMNVMTRALPNLQQITLGHLGIEHKYNDGEDPDERWADEYAYLQTHDIDIISNFGKLRELAICSAPLNGRYSVLFNSFPLLEKLSIEYCYRLKWDLEMLAGFPLLEELECQYNRHLTGNICSLRVLKDTLVKVTIKDCDNVEGNFMDLADFPILKGLDLEDTAVTGDIRDISDNDFSSLEQLILPKGVYGGKGYEFQRIADGPDLVRAVYLFSKQRPALKMEEWYATLSEDSPDRYESVGEEGDSPPFYISYVKAGPRIGYRWESSDNEPCEVNWLDPEPEREICDYEKYIEELQEINTRVLYRGFHQPPTEEEYNQLWGRF